MSKSTETQFKILKDILGGKDVLYVSTPINTGERFMEWYESVGNNLGRGTEEYKKKHNTDVVEPNVKNAKTFVKELKNSGRIIIDPTTFESEALEWTQEEFFEFWDKVVCELVTEIIFLDGWEYSIGCSCEMLSVAKSKITAYKQDGSILTIEEATKSIEGSIEKYEQYGMKESTKMKQILKDINSRKDGLVSCNDLLDRIELKDDKLHEITASNLGNVAQFISFAPGDEEQCMTPKHIHINNFDPKETKLSTKELIKLLVQSAPSKLVNIRSFSPGQMKGSRFVFGKNIDQIDEVLDAIRLNSSEGKFSIVNENIDISDGGVSGVIIGELIEFSPNDTPRCVEKEGVCSLPKDIAFKLFEKIYEFKPETNFSSDYRVEFSIHPMKQGVNKTHTILWEYENFGQTSYERKITWPNNFSKHIGDKAFGLLIADTLGLPVPRTTVIPRTVAPFTFGTETGSKEKWMRTCPITKQPGLFFTGKSWTDPFILMNEEEAKGNAVEGTNINVHIASLLSQDGVQPKYSGAAIVRKDSKNDIIEGVNGDGDDFMVGEQTVDKLPRIIVEEVKELSDKIRTFYGLIGEVSYEWVYDGNKVWLVQLNQLKRELAGEFNESTIVPEIGNNPVGHYEELNVSEGLDALRKKLKEIEGKNIGIELVGNVGITSHFGDLLRLSNTPSKIRRK